MTSDPFDYFETRNGASVPDRLVNGILHLYEAWKCANGFEFDLWQFAMNVRELRELGVTQNDCRWLHCCELVLHGLELTLEGDQVRSFRAFESNSFTNRSGFILTEKGVELAEELSQDTVLEVTGNPGNPRELTPVWNELKQELYLGDQLVKRFKLPAANQTAVLNAFQEENWIPRIDDPLPPKAGRDPKKRLHDTINSLNRNQRVSLIRFYGDGTGQGVCWKLNH